ncbi:MAG: glycosyltransferase family 8 protein [Planctomycetota bacterium]|nr:glycosyltransferase family 8 protein [Planctomycetota bacterium]
MTMTPDSAENSPVLLVCAANEYFAVGLAVSLYSLLIHSDARRAYHIHILDGGIADESWNRLENTLAKSGRNVHLGRLVPPLSRFDGLPRDTGASHLAYARLLIPELVAEPKCIYLDADLVFQRDLAQLWDLDFSGHAIIATQDLGLRVLGNEKCDCQGLGLDPQAPYFNSGLMVLDLCRWRQAGVCEATMNYVKRHPERCPYWDQSALNVTLYRQWKPVDPGWNFPSLFVPQLDSAAERAAVNIHFVNRIKPWFFGHEQAPAAGTFYQYLDCTDFRGWRPTRLSRLQSVLFRAFPRMVDRGDQIEIHASAAWMACPPTERQQDLAALCDHLAGQHIGYAKLLVLDPRGNVYSEIQGPAAKASGGK